MKERPQTWFSVPQHVRRGEVSYHDTQTLLQLAEVEQKSEVRQLYAENLSRLERREPRLYSQARIREGLTSNRYLFARATTPTYDNALAAGSRNAGKVAKLNPARHMDSLPQLPTHRYHSLDESHWER